MSLRYLLLLSSSLFLLMNSCKKENITAPIQINEQNIDTCIKFLDTASVVIGDDAMVIVQYNHQLDLSQSIKESDSTKFRVTIKSETRAQISIIRDSIFRIRGNDSTWYNRVGLYYTNLDSHFYFGANTDIVNGYIVSEGAFLAGDTLNYFNLDGENNYRPDCYYSLGRIWWNNIRRTVLSYAESKNGARLTVNRWTEGGSRFSELNGIGYLCFRYLEDDLIKYGWVKIDISSPEQAEIIEVAYMH